jgi:diacylglycerol O-acyltransferase
VAQIASQPLDRTRPLWELWVIEGLADGRVALVFKAHHAVADGVSAIQLLLRLLDSSPEGADVGGSLERVRTDPAPTSRALLAHALSRLPERSARFARLLRDTAASAVSMRCPSVDPGRPGTGRLRRSGRWLMEGLGSLM